MNNQFLEALIRAGLSVIPTRKDKRPALASWTSFQATAPTESEAKSWAPSYGLGVICGPVSGGVFCIDIDTKHDIRGGVVEDYSQLIKEQAPDLLERLVVEKTPSGGYHFIGRCKTSIRNLKLAKNEKHEAIIETRGDGGYFCAAPTPFYKLIRGRLEAIEEIAPEELDILLDCARALNQEAREAPRPSLPQSLGTSPFDAYDAQAGAETVALMEAHGWKVMFRRGETVYLKRPDKTGRAISATWNHIPDRLYVFTTSTLFESEHVYKACAVYTMLEHGGDFRAAAKALAAKGYSDKPSKPAEKPLTVAAAPHDLIAKVHHLYDHGMKAGVSPGWSELGKLYQVVKGQLNVVTGIPSHGKSEFTDALMVNLALKEGWNFVVYSPENYPVELHARKLVEKLAGRNMFGPKRIPRENLGLNIDWVTEHFTFLDGCDEDVTLDSIFEAVLEQRKIRPVDGVLIDPWNELESTRPEKVTETDFIGQCLKRCRMFARKFEIAFWIVAHPYKLRKDPKTGKYPIPTMYDISGSAHWYNKADNGIAVWRDFTNNQTDVHIQKIKFKYYGKAGVVSMKYEPQSGRYKEMDVHAHFSLPQSRQLPVEHEEENA